MNRLRIFLDLMFFLNKNLFFEKFSFLKSKSEKSNTLGYGLWFIIKGHIMPWICLFLLLKILNNPGISLGLIITLMFIKLIRIDNIDWKLYFRHDFCLAFPENADRFKIILIGNLIKFLLLEEITPLYILFLVFFTPVKIIYAICIYIIFTILFIFCLSYYYLLETGSVSIKKVYSFLSYLFSMLSTFAITYIIINTTILLIKKLDLYTFKQHPDKVIELIKEQVVNIADNILKIEILFENNVLMILLFILLILLITLICTALSINRNNGNSDRHTLIFSNFSAKISKYLCRKPIEETYFIKEVKLFSYLLPPTHSDVK